MNIEIPKENLTIEQIIFEKYPVPKAAATMIIPTIISYICASYPKHRSIKNRKLWYHTRCYFEYDFESNLLTF